MNKLPLKSKCLKSNTMNEISITFAYESTSVMQQM